MMKYSTDLTTFHHSINESVLCKIYIMRSRIGSTRRIGRFITPPGHLYHLFECCLRTLFAETDHLFITVDGSIKGESFQVNIQSILMHGNNGI